LEGEITILKPLLRVISTTLWEDVARRSPQYIKALTPEAGRADFISEIGMFRAKGPPRTIRTRSLYIWYRRGIIALNNRAQKIVTPNIVKAASLSVKRSDIADIRVKARIPTRIIFSQMPTSGISSWIKAIYPPHPDTK